MEAWIYARFSTLEQARGSSLKRQLDDCRAYCDRKGWSHASERELIDEGLSAYTGKNRADGSRLAWFEQQVAGGRCGENPILVVERFDRISRQNVFEVFKLVERLTDQGVRIATVDGDQLYSRGAFDLSTMIMLLAKAQLSHDESEKKSQRLTAAWEYKRHRANAGDPVAFTRRCPAWLEVSTAGEYRLRPDRADIVKQIFAWTIAGQGKHMIARRLNEAGVANWSTRRTPGGWHPSYIQKVLSSRATLGEFQAHRRTALGRVPIGEPWPDFFPAVVDAGTYAAAQAEKQARTGKGGRRGPRYANLFTGIAKCGSCGNAMTYRNKGKPHEQYLTCDHAARGRGCTNRRLFNYHLVEDDAFKFVLGQALNAQATANDEVRDAEALAGALSHALSERERNQKNLIGLYENAPSSTVGDRIVALDGEILLAKSRLAAANQAVLVARGSTPPEQRLARVKAIARDAQSGDDAVAIAARAEVSQAFRGLMTGMTFDETGLVTIKMNASEFCFKYDGRKRVGEVQRRRSRQPEPIKS